MPKKEATPQLESTEKFNPVATEPPNRIEQLKSEIQGFQIEIQRLQRELRELRPTPQPHPSLSPTEFAQAIISGSTELEEI